MPLSEARIAEFRQRLLDRLAALADSSEKTRQDRAPVELDQQSVGRLSRMDALQMQAMAQAADRARGGEAGRIKAALARLEEGDYGYCVGCGEEIAEKRLEIEPTVPTCIACAARAERG
ncbi:TraR/DksA family transcriptional regulator [Roseospirillum parvum]|uniref:DnaK suppressor protein n=1 Tax=Roseospirillum parvum TaxID=83401 RepID=A0A1G8CZN5_9PROT|nr:TraR/DksA family transcriptional regulator [Roseospirillum parvum]SDH51067.1 DnaK suppressor protein [Roseospirillum parvum]